MSLKLNTESALKLKTESASKSVPVVKKSALKQQIQNQKAIDPKIQNIIKQMYGNLSDNVLSVMGYKWFEILTSDKYAAFGCFDPNKKEKFVPNPREFMGHSQADYDDERESCMVFGKLLQSLVLGKMNEDEAYWLAKKRMAEQGWTYWNVNHEKYYHQKTVTVEMLKADWKELSEDDEEDAKTLQADYALLTEAFKISKELLVVDAKLRSLQL